MKLDVAETLSAFEALKRVPAIADGTPFMPDSGTPEKGNRRRISRHHGIMMLYD
jgi:hypothetical protein